MKTLSQLSFQILSPLALLVAPLFLTGAPAYANSDSLCTTQSRGQFFQLQASYEADARRGTFDACRLSASTDPIECGQALRCYQLDQLVSEKCTTFSNGRQFQLESSVPNFARFQVAQDCSKDRFTSVYECMSNLRCETNQVIIPSGPVAPPIVVATNRALLRGRFYEAKLEPRSSSNTMNVVLRDDRGNSWIAGENVMSYSGQPYVISFGDGLKVFYINTMMSAVEVYSYPANTTEFLAPMGSPNLSLIESVYTLNGQLFVTASDDDGTVYQTRAEGRIRWTATPARP
jgi:hypothetical protein